MLGSNTLLFVILKATGGVGVVIHGALLLMYRSIALRATFLKSNLSTAVIRTLITGGETMLTVAIVPVTFIERLMIAIVKCAVYGVACLTANVRKS